MSQPDLEDLPLGLIVGDTVRAAADRVADEIVRLLSGTTVRDRASGVSRAARPADLAILFRSRDSHREYESALDRRGVPTYVYKGLGFFDADEIQDAIALLRYLADPHSDLRAAAFLRSRLVRLSDDGVMRLAPHIAAAILASEPLDGGPEGPRAVLSTEDALVLTRTRAAVARWLAWVDRMTPSELVDAVLRESAYAYELGGFRRLQARENLKKLRGLIRRVQNRGYATLARVADHLEQLALGDESNAAIDAVEAVSLMTVHAAKGLEFPVVFLVNMGRGAGGARAPIRIATDASGDPSVAIADYQSEADEDAQSRDREETKRLLYVALTRARDRVYLSATVQNGTCRMGRGSLGEVLPASFKALFVDAGGVSQRLRPERGAGRKRGEAEPPSESEREPSAESAGGGAPAPWKTWGPASIGNADAQQDGLVVWSGPEGRIHQLAVPRVHDEPRRLALTRLSAPPLNDFGGVADQTETASDV